MEALRMKWLMVLQIVAVLVLGVGSVGAQTPGSGAGTVAETMDVDNYVYIRLEENGAWLATSPVAVGVGDRIEYAGAFPMREFYSATLERTFDEILFAGSVRVLSGDAETASDAMDVAHGGGLPSGHPPLPVAGGDIEALDGGMTIGAIYANAADREGAEVSLRARVVKFSPNILGKNWVTLQDGTGTPPDDSLVATTAETVDVGAVVVATGTVRSDIDLGYGYSYKVVLEQATFSD